MAATLGVERKLINTALAAAVQTWCELDMREETQKETRELLRNLKEEELAKLFLVRLDFGTAGLRGRMGAGFSRMNDVTIQQTSQGYCAFLVDRFGVDGNDRGVVVGFDARHNSRRFAKLTAAVFLSKGVRVRLFQDFVHTPIVPYTLVKSYAMAGIMVTASHNPKTDNGYKVFAENGAQIIPPMDSDISAFITNNLAFWPEIEEYFDRATGELTEKATRSPLLETPFDDIIDAYVRDVAADLRISQPPDAGNGPKFAYTAMHGVGTPMVKRMFSAFGFEDKIITVDAQCCPDPEFPTVAFPNPEEKGALDLAFKEADAHGVQLVIANDPDADRFAAAEKYDGRWYQFTGDELGAIFGAYAVALRAAQGLEKSRMALICSAVSSRMLHAIAKYNNCVFAETMTGFKWMENKAIDLEAQGFTPVLVYEEALGYALSQRVRDKDGVSAAAVWVQMATELYAKGQTITDYLIGLRTQYGYFVTKNSYFVCPDPPVIKGLFQDFAHGCNYPSHLGPFVIKRIRDVGRNYDSDEPDKKCVFPPNCEMLTLYLDNGAVVTLRGSGTEPKLKYYAEISSSSPEQGLEELDKVIKAVVFDFVKPDLHPAVQVSLP
ncbi:glucosephosphate-mutase GPM2 [Besnoitia besnoiti]|uniref:Glucosephosphate-mutase GPM2 n=1 Tax=Besnoitia besnoiti TaxID=94643 RepID=A0A2A9MLE6_BESBE|nr:glucosephosphate-mutase GPM2 [Besnoitia besnoiti]PFH36280.1 glucosephosphate-mutase GPM2 [Besnoitia besnoiti]